MERGQALTLLVLDTSFYNLPSPYSARLSVVLVQAAGNFSREIEYPFRKAVSQKLPSNTDCFTPTRYLACV